MKSIMKVVGQISLLTSVFMFVAPGVFAEAQSDWFDNTNNIEIEKSNPIFSRRGPNVQVRFSLQNISQEAIERPYRLAFEDLPQGVSIQGAKLQQDGTPYLDLEYLIGDSLDPNVVKPNFTVTFLNVGRKALNYTPAIYSPLPVETTNCQKVRTIDGIRYCFNVNTNDTNRFINVTVARFNPSSQSYDASKVVLSADDLGNRGDREDEDFTKSLVRSIKWFSCPSTGKSSMYAKRQAWNDDGTFTATRDLLRATVTNPQGQIDSPWTDALLVGKPYGYSSGDLGDFNDDGNKYIVTAELDEIMIMQLEADCSDVLATNDGEPLLKRQWLNANGSVDSREAPAIFKVDDTWFLHTSGKTGWRPNQHKYAYASSLEGPWSDMINIGDFTGYHSQAFFIAQNRGTEITTKIFPGTRNAAIVPGPLGHGNIRLPMYINQPNMLSVNYYDYIVEEADGRVIGKHNDHGQKLSVVDYSVTDFPNIKPYELVDDNIETAWLTNNPEVKQITFDLGQPQLVKAIKVRNFNFNGSWNNFMSDYKIEIGNGVDNWTTVWDKWILLMDWLQPLDIEDTEGQFIRFTHKQTRRTQQNVNTDDWGFYQIDFWGNEQWQEESLFDDFEDDNLLGWNVEQSSEGNVVSIVDSDIGKVLNIVDETESGRSKVIYRFSEQTSSELTFSMKMKFDVLGKGEYIRLLNGTQSAIELRNSAELGNFSLIRGNGEEVKIADLIASQWYNLSVNVNLDTHSFDLFIDGKVVWGGELLINDLNYINALTIGTTNLISGSNASFDDVRFKGPLTPGYYEVPEAPEVPAPDFFVDDFESGYDTNLWSNRNWISASYLNSGTVRSTAFDSITARGDFNWGDYTVSADVQRNGKISMLLGRVSAGNISYYELAIIRDSQELALRKRTANGIETLTSIPFDNQDTSRYYKLSLKFEGSTVTAMADGQEAFVYNDPNPLLTGRIGLKKAGGSRVNFDNVVVEAN